MMTELLSPETIESLEYFLKKDSQAISYTLDMLFLAHGCDDIHDQDVENTKENIRLLFRKIYVDVPLNPFYRKHSNELAPLMANSYLMWSASVALENGDEHSRFACFQIRNFILSVIAHCIYLVGGSDWADSVLPDYWLKFAPKLDKWEELKVE